MGSVDSPLGLLSTYPSWGEQCRCSWRSQHAYNKLDSCQSLRTAPLFVATHGRRFPTPTISKRDYTLTCWVPSSGTTAENMMKLPKIYNPWFVAVIATLGGALFGFDISSMSAIIGTPQYRNYFDNPAGIFQGSIGAALAAGSVVGSVIAGPISNWCGRRNSIAIACVPWLIGTAVQAAVTGVGMLIAGRVLNGITVGITSSQVPVYLAEIAKREKRGALIIIQQLAIGTVNVQ